MHQYADVGSASVGRHFASGQRTDHLFVPAHRVHCRNGDHIDFRADCGSLHGGECRRFVLFDADHDFDRAHCVPDEADALDDFGRAFAHEPVVASDIGLALAAVDDERAHLVLAREIQFHCRGKSRSAHADDARSGHARSDLVRCQCKRIGYDLCLQPAVFAVRFYCYRRRGQPGWMCRRKITDGEDAPGSRRMHGSRNDALSGADELPLQHLVVHIDQGLSGCTHVLQQGHVQALRHRQNADRAIRRQFLAAFRMYPAT